MNKTSLFADCLFDCKEHREGFYVQEEEGSYRLYYMNAKFKHGVPINKEFYDAFVEESKRNEEKYNKMLNHE